MCYVVDIHVWIFPQVVVLKVQNIKILQFNYYDFPLGTVSCNYICKNIGNSFKYLKIVLLKVSAKYNKSFNVRNWQENILNWSK